MTQQTAINLATNFGRRHVRRRFSRLSRVHARRAAGADLRKLAERSMLGDPEYYAPEPVPVWAAEARREWKRAIAKAFRRGIVSETRHLIDAF